MHAESWPSDLPRTLLIGAGVVGRAIAEAHVIRGLSFCLADQSSESLAVAEKELQALCADAKIQACPIDGLRMLVVRGPGDVEGVQADLLVIESVVEKLDIKRALFGMLQERFGNEVTLCSNTSTLLIDEIAGGREIEPGKLCGMHFFMPVRERAGVEIVTGARTDPETVDSVVAHAKRLGKHAIRCQDGPGFIVNRMLSPYLNQALLLLCRGASEEQIGRVALAYGMPISPLELIDWIGMPTMYHAGRAFCNAFPRRVDPSPVVPAMLKRKRLGRATGQGLYDYRGTMRSRELAAETTEVIETYRVDSEPFSDHDALLLLTIPMWIEATCLLREGIAASMDIVDLAMVAGLGYCGEVHWSGFFAELGESTIDAAVQRWGNEYRSMMAE